MITDSLACLGRYRGLHPALDTAIDWLQTHELDALPLGRTEIDGQNVFVNVMDAALRAADRPGGLGVGRPRRCRRAVRRKGGLRLCRRTPPHRRRPGRGALRPVPAGRIPQAELHLPRQHVAAQGGGQDPYGRLSRPPKGGSSRWIRKLFSNRSSTG